MTSASGTLNPLRLFVELALIMVVIETALMQLLPTVFDDLSGWEAALADALAIATLAGPLILWRTLRMLRPRVEPGFDDTEKPSHPWRWALLVMLVGCSLTIWRTKLLHEEISARAELAFTHQIERLDADIQNSFAQIVQALRGTRGMIDAYPEVDRYAFSKSIASRNLFNELTGLRGLGFIESVLSSELDALTQRERRDGAPDFTVKGIGGGPINASTPYVIRFVEPIANNRAAVGLDIASEKNRKAAADLSAQGGEPVLTDVITLAQDNKKRAGALLLLPTYRGGGIPSDVDARIASLRGWVYAALVYDELFASARDATQGLIAFDIALRERGVPEQTRSTPNEETRIFQATGNQSSNAPRLHNTHTLKLGQQDFVLRVTSTEKFETGFDWSGATRPAIAGAFVSTLLALAIWLLMTGRNRALEKAKELTKSVRDAYLQMETATRRVETVLQAAPFGILIVNAQGKIVMCNPAADRMFGYDGSELLMQPVEQLVPLAARSGHNAHMASYALNQTPRRMGANRRLTARRKDGSEIPVEVGLNPLIVGDDSSVLVTILDISERAHAEDELALYRQQLEMVVSQRTAEAMRAKETAEKANAAKTLFLSNMSHELRTPLHAVLSFAKLGKKRSAETPDVPPKLAQYFEKIVDGGERLLTLVNALFELSSLESGKRTFNFAPLALHTLIDEAVRVAEPEASPRSIRFITELPSEEIIARLDADSMRSVLNKLLNNAIQFSPVGGEVILRVHLERNVENEKDCPVLLISIADHGIGIPESELESVFDAFVQSSKTETGAGGKGLGLAICREIITAHGGKISASANPGGGAVITIALPLAQDASSG